VTGVAEDLTFPKLPHLEKLRVEHIDSRSDAPPLAAFFDFISSYPSLTYFAIDAGLWGRHTTAPQLASALGSFERLSKLHLSGVDFTAPSPDDATPYQLPLCLSPPIVSPAFTRVTTLIVSSSNVAFAGLSTLPQLVGLKTLVLERCTFVMDDDEGSNTTEWVSRTWSDTVSAMPRLRKLAWLYCACEMKIDIRHPKLGELDWRASDEGEKCELSAIACPRLHTLTISLDHLRFGSGFSLSGLVSTTPLLRSLVVSGLEDEDTDALWGFRQLVELSLVFKGTSIVTLGTGMGMASHNLQQLTLNHIAASNESMKRVLEGCPRLVVLSLDSIRQVTDLNDIQHRALSVVQLTNMPHLSGTIDLKGTY
jgi:hypothetical protein